MTRLWTAAPGGAMHVSTVRRILHILEPSGIVVLPESVAGRLMRSIRNKGGGNETKGTVGGGCRTRCQRRCPARRRGVCRGRRQRNGTEVLAGHAARHVSVCLRRSKGERR